MLHYKKITWYLAINRGQILGQFGGYKSTRVIFESELKESAFTSSLVIKGYYMIQYLCMNNDIRASSNRACNCASTDHDFGFSKALQKQHIEVSL